VLSVLALREENPDPTDEELDHYLAGNLCRCSGYASQRRAIREFLAGRGKR
jgi:carbon-monoxide dehydrogenase small subunit